MKKILKSSLKEVTSINLNTLIILSSEIAQNLFKQKVPLDIISQAT